MRRVDDFVGALTSEWRRADGQMRNFLAALCRGIEKLHNDMSYVLIGGQR